MMIAAAGFRHTCHHMMMVAQAAAIRAAKTPRRPRHIIVDDYSVRRALSAHILDYYIADRRRLRFSPREPHKAHRPMPVSMILPEIEALTYFLPVTVFHASARLWLADVPLLPPPHTRVRVFIDLSPCR